MNALMPQSHAHASPVMVIEDDHDLRVSVRNLLEDEGYEVLTAANGRSALELVQASSPKPCLIILDLMLPIMDGWHFATELRKRPDLAAIPLLIMSAFRQPPPPDAVGFLPKPVELDVLLRYVGEYCD